MTWSEAETDVADACINALSNVTASIDLTSGTVSVPGVLENEYVESNGMAGQGVLLRVESDGIRGVKRGTVVRMTMDSVKQAASEARRYKVVDIQDDGHGVTDLVLQKQ